MRIYLPETSTNLPMVYRNCPATKTMPKVFFVHPSTGELSCAINVPYHLIKHCLVSHLTGANHYINDPKVVAKNASLYELNALGRRVGKNYLQCKDNTNCAMKRVKMILRDELENEENGVWENLAEEINRQTTSQIGDTVTELGELAKLQAGQIENITENFKEMSLVTTQTWQTADRNAFDVIQNGKDIQGLQARNATLERRVEELEANRNHLSSA